MNDLIDRIFDRAELAAAKAGKQVAVVVERAEARAENLWWAGVSAGLSPGLLAGLILAAIITRKGKQ
jgi:hypothetical protein